MKIVTDDGREIPLHFLPQSNKIVLDGSQDVNLKSTYEMNTIQNIIETWQEKLPDRPEMINRWACWNTTQKEWYIGYISKSGMTMLINSHTANIVSESRYWDLSSFECDRFDDLPDKLRRKIFNAQKK